jgi:hypothetical protein
MVSCGWLGVSAYQTCILLGYMIENSRFTVQVGSVFRSVVVVAFQIIFRAEIHANDIFLFFKNHF